MIVPLRDKSVVGVIAGPHPKPNFTTKPITEALQLQHLPAKTIDLIYWLAAYYCVPLGLATQQFLPSSLSNKLQYFDNNTSPIDISALPKLSDEQQKSVDKITTVPGTYILHGETGSGKTRVYLELAVGAFKDNKSSIILTPEIGLTPQLAKQFTEVFGVNNVIITHSRLPKSARHKLWVQTLQSDKPLVIIGPRSALFYPLRKPGLIIMDEAHEPTYRQEQSPRYQTSTIAAKYAELYQAKLVLGSATPNITDYYLANRRQRPILRMHQLPSLRQDTAEVDTQLIDLKNRSHFTKSSYLSNELLTAIQATLDKHKQSLLFLNRRGTARLTVCSRCGWRALCPHCNLPTTYHADTHLLRCHTCGFYEAARTSCPVCGNTNIQLKSVGTKAISDEVARLFPHATIRRFDTDNKREELIENHYEAIHSGKIDILIGTQLLAKGFDLPKLSVVGIVAADSSLYLPDYSTDERAYQLIHQVAGRIGRGHTSGTLIVQSYDPESFIIQSAIKHDWQSFYDHELRERQKFVFPPFCFLLRVTCRRASQKRAEEASLKLKTLLIAQKLNIVIDGPTPRFHEKVGNKYEWQLTIKTKKRSELAKVISYLPSGWSFEMDPLNLL